MLFKLQISNLSMVSQKGPGSNPGSGGTAHFYCGNSSDNFFWIAHSQKYMPSMQNSEWETFYVKWISGPCARLQQLQTSQKLVQSGAEA